MKTISIITKVLLTIVFMINGVSCNSQNKINKTGGQQAVDPTESVMVNRDAHGTKQEELQGQLQLALGDTNIEELTILLRKGANANKLPGNTDITPLMLAETKNIAQLLLKNNANPLVNDANGQNLLHYAVSKENALDLIPLYASLGIDVNAQDLEKHTPLSLAIVYFEETNAISTEPVPVGKENYDSEEKIVKPNPTEILKALVKAGADLNAFDQYGHTILMNCVTKDNSELPKTIRLKKQ